MKTYNGHRSWNSWNISLWISNEEPLYRFALDCIAKIQYLPPTRRAKRGLRYATNLFMNDMGGTKTPDGAIYNHLSVKLALQCLMED